MTSLTIGILFFSSASILAILGMRRLAMYLTGGGLTLLGLFGLFGWNYGGIFYSPINTSLVGFLFVVLGVTILVAARSKLEGTDKFIWPSGIEDQIIVLIKQLVPWCIIALTIIVGFLAWISKTTEGLWICHP